jgi:hypothetical protein
MIRAAAVTLVVCACSSALHEPRPVGVLAPGESHGRGPDELMRDGNEAWARRGQPGAAAAAQDAYLDAAAADERRIDALLGAMRVLSYRIEREQGVDRGQLAGEEVELGQWCQRRAPLNAECDYRLAIALGQQARERTSTGRDALNRIVPLLRRAIAAAPRLDHGGPERVLALVHLRAPAWPVGPGDPDAALEQARAAVALFPEYADNQLALGEALAATDAPGEARAAYARALALATSARDLGDPDAAAAIDAARAGLAHAGDR